MEARFLTKVVKCENGCWEWSEYKDKDGYGIYKQHRAHRVAYELWKGKIPSGQLVRHTCDNPPCVNPEHLLVGTQTDNMNDMVKRNRHTAVKGQQQRGSKLTDDIVREIRILEGFGFTLKELGNMYQVHISTIWRTINGKNWKHI